jgi:hypothetical protein
MNRKNLMAFKGLTISTAKAYAVQPFVWTLGGIFGSAMGGFLAQPTRFYPGLFAPGTFWEEYPYLLPNLVAVVIIVLAIIQGIFFLEETNPKEVYTDNAIDDNASVMDETASLLGPRASIAGSLRRRSQASRAPRPSFIEEGLPAFAGQQFDIRKSSFATIHSIRFAPEEVSKIRRDMGRPENTRRTTGRAPVEEYTGKAFNYTIIMVTLALVIVSFHSMAYLSLLPTWILDEPKAAVQHLDLQGGLGMTVHDVGVYLAINGAVGLFIQAIIFPIFVEKIGIWKSFIWMVILFPLPYFMLPFITAGPANMTSALIYVSLFLQSFVGIIIYPAALILLKDATPSPQVLGKVNGLAMSVSSTVQVVRAPPGSPSPVPQFWASSSCLSSPENTLRPSKSTPRSCTARTRIRISSRPALPIRRPLKMVTRLAILQAGHINSYNQFFGKCASSLLYLY